MNQDSSDVRIYDALVALLHRGEEDSFVLIEEPQSEKFVQVGKGRCLGMDVPCVALTNLEAERASKFFHALGEECPREYNAPNPKTGRRQPGAAFYHDFGNDAKGAAKAALAFFVEVYGFPADVELSVKER
jgi:hypothetical protein